MNLNFSRLEVLQQNRLQGRDCSLCIPITQNPNKNEIRNPLEGDYTHQIIQIKETCGIKGNEAYLYSFLIGKFWIIFYLLLQEVYCLLLL